MKKSNILQNAGKGIALTAALAAVLFASSCKKEAQITPEGSAGAAGSTTPAKTVIAQSNYKVSQPITLNGAHDMTISGDSISGGANSCISLINCYNIHITKCKLVNSSAMGVSLSACSNIIVDDCNAANVATGVFAYNSKSISVMNNKMGSLTSANRVVFENLGDNVNDAVSNSAMNNELAQ